MTSDKRPASGDWTGAAASGEQCRWSQSPGGSGRAAGAVVTAARGLHMAVGSSRRLEMTFWLGSCGSGASSNLAGLRLSFGLANVPRVSPGCRCAVVPAMPIDCGCCLCPWPGVRIAPDRPILPPFHCHGNRQPGAGSNTCTVASPGSPRLLHDCSDHLASNAPAVH